MLRKLLLVLLFFNLSFAISQNINRGELSITLFEELYGVGNNPTNYPASSYPTPFLDLREGEPLTDSKPYAILLSYLDFGDGISVVDRNSIVFDSQHNVSRIEFIRNLLEAWNITPSDVTTLPYSDYPNASFGEDFGYMRKAYELGLLPNTTNIFPYEFVTYTYVNSFINNLRSIQSPPSLSELDNLDNYFIPNNYTPENFGIPRSIEQGVFNHYAKNSFVISDIKFNLNFSHYYSTSMVEIPESYYPIQPLGRGWTHTYNSYIVRKENVGISQTDYYNIVWSDGSINIYNDNSNEYVTKGIYDTFDELGSNRIRIIKKNQIKYYFEKLDSGENIYYLNEIRDRNGNELIIEYEQSDVDSDLRRIQYVQVPSGKRLNFHYHDNTDFIDYIDDPLNRNIRFTYNEERLRYFYDAKNQSTRYYYLSNDEDAPEEHQYKRFLLKKIRLPRGNKIEAEYDTNNNGKLSQYKVNDNPPIIIQPNFDDFNNITSNITVPMPDGTNQNYNYQYNSNGMLTEFHNATDDIVISYPTPTSQNSLLPTNINTNGLQIDYNYDDRGNITDKTVEYNIHENFYYNDDNTLRWYRDANGEYTRFYYDSGGHGNLIEVEDALHNSSYFTYDTHGQLESATNQEGIQIDYTYENDGAIESISAPENISSSFIHDDINRLLSKTVNGQTSSFTYDPNDNLKTQTNIGGLTTTFSYDENDNLTKITNANNVDTDFQYNNKDQLESETFVSSTKHYTYNNDGSLQTYIKPSGATINYQYDSFGRIEQTGTITDVDYNNDGLISSIANADSRYDFTYNIVNRLRFVENSDTNEIVEYSYDDVGNITEMRYPNNPLNLFVRYQYDAKNRLIHIKLTINGNSNIIATYEYLDDDRLSNILYTNGIYTQYQYDNAGRKTGVFHYNSSGGLLFSEILSLDNRGNVSNSQKHYATTTDLPFSVPNIAEQNFTYDNNNHIQNGYSVNSDGNLISSPTSSFSYNIDDQLTNRNTNGDTFSYEYDAYGNRISKTKNGYVERYIWDIVHKNPIMKTDESGLNIEHYNIFGLGLEVQVLSNGIIHFYHGDTRGNVVVTTTESGEIGRKYKYDDFGKVSNVGVGYNPDHNHFTFMGKYGILDEDKVEGLYYVRARYYDAQTGRFLTQDPIWSANLYPYANNNPISNVDPSGKSEFYSLVASIPSTISSYYGWDDYFYNQYGGAAMYLSENNKSWDYAISNPKTAGVFIAGGAFVAGSGVLNGLAIFTSIQSGVGIPFAISQGVQGYFYLTGSAEAIQLTSELLGHLQDYKNGVSGSEVEVFKTLLNLYGPEFLSKNQQFYVNVLKLFKK